MAELSKFTTGLGIEYPDENSDPFHPNHERGMEQIDLYDRSLMEDASLTVVGGGTLGLNLGTSEVSWSADLLLIDARNNKVITISAGAVVVPDGQIASITGVSRPLVTATLGVWSVSAAGPGADWTKIPVFRRVGNNVYLVRNQIGLERVTLPPP